MDDRTLRRRRCHAGGSQAVKRPSDAAPKGGSSRASGDDCEAAAGGASGSRSTHDRLAAVERQVDLVFEGQVGVLHHLHTVEDQRHDAVQDELRAARDREAAMLHRLDELEGRVGSMSTAPERVAALDQDYGIIPQPQIKGIPALTFFYRWVSAIQIGTIDQFE